MDDARGDASAAELLFPLHVEGEALPIPTMAPTVGEHTDEVLVRVVGHDRKLTRR